MAPGRLLANGQPIFLDDAMRPVEPASLWFRLLAMDGLDHKSMKAYVYSIRRLLVFLGQRGADVLSATETELLEFRYWRTQAQAERSGRRRGSGTRPRSAAWTSGWSSSGW
jgi:hypothetical protein